MKATKITWSVTPDHYITVVLPESMAKDTVIARLGEVAYAALDAVLRVSMHTEQVED